MVSSEYTFPGILRKQDTSSDVMTSEEPLGEDPSGEKHSGDDA